MLEFYAPHWEQSKLMTRFHGDLLKRTPDTLDDKAEQMEEKLNNTEDHTEKLNLTGIIQSGLPRMFLEKLWFGQEHFQVVPSIDNAGDYQDLKRRLKEANLELEALKHLGSAKRAKTGLHLRKKACQRKCMESFKSLT